MSLLHPHRNFGYLHVSLTPTQKFWISPRVSYTHKEIRDISPGLLHPHRNSGYLLGSLTPTQKFEIAPRVSYTHTEIRDISPSLLHPHRNLGYLLGSLTSTQKFGISPRVSYTHTEIRDISPGLSHPHRTFRILPRVSFTLTVRTPPPGPLRRGVVPLTGHRGMSHALFFRLRESSNPRPKGHIEMESTLTTN